MDFCCPQCNSTDLEKLSLAYEEGISHINARTRLRGVVVGSDGPDLVIGSGITKGIQQTAISKAVAPPARWSYKRLFGWSVLSFLAVGWIVFYRNTVTTNSESVLSVPLTLYIVVSLGIFAVLVTYFWKHNAGYRLKLAKWDRSFLCNCCGNISEH